MAKKYICKVCGYVHTGDKAPAVCPQCQQTNCFEEEKKKGIDTNSNVYTIIRRSDCSRSARGYQPSTQSTSTSKQTFGRAKANPDRSQCRL